MTNCLLESSTFFVLGVGLGMYYAIKLKRPKMFFVTATAGTAVDFVYAYTYSCEEVVRDFNQARENALKSQFKSQN